MSDPRTVSRLGAKLALRLAPWLAMAAMAALRPWRNAHRAADAPVRRRTPTDFDAAEPDRGRAAAWPGAIPGRGWKDILWRSYWEIGQDRLPALAGGVTFYLLLAIFPGIAAFVSIYGLFLDVGGVQSRLAQLAEVFPQDAVSLIGEQMLRLARQKHSTLGAAFLVSTLVSVWSANAGMKALFDGLNVVYEEPEKRYYLWRSLITYTSTAVGMLFLCLVVGLIVVAPVYLRLLGVAVDHQWWVALRWLLVYFLAVLAFTWLYRHGPSRTPPKWRWVAGGGFLAAAVWMLGSLGFSWYVNTFTHFGITYGSLGAMIGLMLWIWFSVMVVLFGGELNAEIEHQTAVDSTVGPDKPMGERGAVMADNLGKAFTVSAREARIITRDFVLRQVEYVADLFRGIWRI